MLENGEDQEAIFFGEPNNSSAAIGTFEDKVISNVSILHQQISECLKDKFAENYITMSILLQKITENFRALAVKFDGSSRILGEKLKENFKSMEE